MATKTASEWEEVVGEQVRRLRLLQGLDQGTIASRAGVALNALRSLESGRGCRLRTLVAVLRALDRASWLETLSPAITISPLDKIRHRKERQRGRKPVPTRRSR